MKKIISIGMMIADVLVKPVDKFPAKGNLMPIDSCTLATGGCALNTAVVLARLQEHVSLIGIVGKDIFGDFVISDIQSKGVHIDDVIQKEYANTSCTVVLLNSDGERSFLASHGATKLLEYADLNTDYIFSCDIVHIGSALFIPKLDGKPLAKFLQEAQNHGCITVVDTCAMTSKPWKEKITPILPYTDYFMPSYEEAQEISGVTREEDITQFFINHGSTNIVIKLGEKGAYLHTKDCSAYMPAMSSEIPVDTTGAGDCFVAGFICGLAHQWSAIECAIFANGAASFIVEAVGANNNAPTRAQVLERLSFHGYTNRHNFQFS